jgi:hypothetical protein
MPALIAAPAMACDPFAVPPHAWVKLVRVNVPAGSDAMFPVPAALIFAPTVVPVRVL